MINYKIQINYPKKKPKHVRNFVFCSYNSIAIKVQLKDLTHMLCFQIFISQTI